MDQTAPPDTSQSSRSQSRLEVRIRRRTRRLATRSDGSRDKLVLATMPNRYSNRTSGHSDTAPSPKARRKPRSNPSKVPTPSGLRDRAPNPHLGIPVGHGGQDQLIPT